MSGAEPLSPTGKGQGVACVEHLITQRESITNKVRVVRCCQSNLPFPLCSQLISLLAFVGIHYHPPGQTRNEVHDSSEIKKTNPLSCCSQGLDGE